MNEQLSCAPLTIDEIPAILWGDPSERGYIYVHGKQASKEAALDLARIAAQKGFQTISFDLPEHGTRTDGRRCDIWNGVEDLTAVAAWAFTRWRHVSLCACSLGAYFSLRAYRALSFSQALFLSPVVDMEYLIRQMFSWFGVTEDTLRQRGEIPTPLDPLRWDYYQYVLDHPVETWPSPTSILYGGQDNLQSREVVEGFAHRFGCRLTVSEESEHSFMSPGDAEIVRQWLRREIDP